MKTHDIPDRLTFPALADALRRSTSWLRDLRNRDPRFPAPDASGRHSVAAVLSLLRLREVERMSEETFASEEQDRRRELLALAFLGASARRRIEALPARTRAEALREARTDFEEAKNTFAASRRNRRPSATGIDEQGIRP